MLPYDPTPKKHPARIVAYILREKGGRFIQRYAPEKVNFARRRRDRLDNAHGSYHHSVDPVFEPCACAECKGGA